ncbi:FAD-dependent oxidoreductase [Streptomyces bobili]|uniref:FAD-dependent oxidoreductase n=1 Tax=Streptomyces bobili TaxID=67280 RepID=UPI00382DBFC1
MTEESVDVLVIGSGFGGSIPAYYLAAAGARVLVLERGPRVETADLSHSMALGSYNRIVDIIQGDGISVVAGNCVGGGSMVYFAASLRAPSFVFERTDSRGTRIWPNSLTRQTLDPWYDRVEDAIPVQQTDWNHVSYAGGVLAAACKRSGHTCNPVPVAVDLAKCVNCNWMLSGCAFDAKRTMLHNYLAAAESHGAEIRSLHEVQAICPSLKAGYRYAVTYYTLDSDDYSCSSTMSVVHAKTVVLAAGAVGSPVILQRSNLFLGGVPQAVGKYFSGNGDRVSVARVDEQKVRTLLGISRSDTVSYQGLPIGRPITAATYDYLNPQSDPFKRFTLQQIYFPPVTNVLAQARGTPTGWLGIDQRDLRRQWRSWLTMLAMTEDENEGNFGAVPLSGSFTRLAPGIGIGSMKFHASSRTRQAWDHSDEALRSILEKDALAEVMPWSEKLGGVLTAHPLGSVRIGDVPATSALDDTHQLRGHPGLFVTDGSAVPSSLTVNPSLTIAALAERAAGHVLNQTQEMGVRLTQGAPLPGA